MLRRSIVHVYQFRSVSFRLKTGEKRAMDSSKKKTTPTTTPKALVRKIEEEAEMTLSFNYSSAFVKDRRFNFQRNQNETLKAVFARIAGNITKITEKKIKRKKMRSQGVPETVFSLDIGLFVNGVKMTDETVCKEAFRDGAILRVDNVDYAIQVNPPVVKKLSLPKNIMAGFFSYPKVELEFADKNECAFTWFRSLARTDDPAKLPNSDGEMEPSVSGAFVTDETKARKEQNASDNSDSEEVPNKKKPWKKVGEVQKNVNVVPFKGPWEEIGSGFSYLVKNDDIGHILKVVCIPADANRTGLPVEGTSNIQVSSGPGFCPFENRHSFTTTATEIGKFRVVSYNILADMYASTEFSHEHLFPTCPPYALAMDYRKQLLLKEILGYHADIICLQEVDISVFDHDLSPALLLDGMDGVLTQKGDHTVPEGVACFFNQTKFVLESNHEILLSKVVAEEPIYADIYEAISKNEQLLNRFKERTTMLQVLVLRSREIPNKKVCVANTHLYFHPDSDHIRLLQASICLRHMEQVVAMEKAKQPLVEVGLLFCGDFNSTPEFGVYQLMTTQFVPAELHDWSSNAEEKVEGLSVSHQFSLTSACGTPPYTNYTAGFQGCLDYVFTDLTQLSLDEVVPLPTHEEVTQFGALPSVIIPSDHLALVCTLNWN